MSTTWPFAVIKFLVIWLLQLFAYIAAADMTSAKYKTIKKNRSLTHWSWVTHTCIGKLAIIGSDNGLSPVRRQAIDWTNAKILFIEPLVTHVNEILIEILSFSFTKKHLKVSSAKWRPLCLCLNVLNVFLAMTVARSSAWMIVLMDHNLHGEIFWNKNHYIFQFCMIPPHYEMFERPYTGYWNPLLIKTTTSLSYTFSIMVLMAWRH